MKVYRKIIRPTDPRVQIQLTKKTHNTLKQIAADNCRRLSDEIVARLIATINNNPHLNQYLMQLMCDDEVTHKN